MATYSKIVAWKISGTEEAGELQSMGLQKSWTQLRDYATTTPHMMNITGEGEREKRPFPSKSPLRTVSNLGGSEKF